MIRTTKKEEEEKPLRASAVTTYAGKADDSKDACAIFFSG